MTTQIQMAIDYGLWKKQLACLDALAPHSPKRRARKLRRKAFFALESGIRNGNVFHCVERTARRTPNLVVEVRVPGMDELIAAAFRAAQRKLIRACNGHGRGSSYEC
jgi:hypothetical protein